MRFNDYQKAALGTALYPGRNNNFIYVVLGLVGEAGEIAEKTKKVIRDKGGIIDDETRETLARELGDVLWYLAMCCQELGLDFDDVAVGNLKKLKDRQDRQVIHGDGDNR